MKELTSTIPNSHSEWQNKIKDFEKLKAEFKILKIFREIKIKKAGMTLE
jgi:hypothetical protein